MQTLRKRRWYLSALLLALLLAACSWALLIYWPRPVRSHRDQVLAALRERSLSAEQISFGERWPDNINFQYGENVFPYAYPLRVVLSNGQVATGHIQCAKLERNCSLSLRELGIDDLRVPDIAQGRSRLLPEWAQKPVDQVLQALGW